jgi:hypothetical protein
MPIIRKSEDENLDYYQYIGTGEMKDYESPKYYFFRDHIPSKERMWDYAKQYNMFVVKHVHYSYASKVSANNKWYKSLVKMEGKMDIEQQKEYQHEQYLKRKNRKLLRRRPVLIMKTEEPAVELDCTLDFDDFETGYQK